MTNCIFFVIISTFLMSYSYGSMCFFSIHRTFINLYRGVLESSILTLDKEGNPIYPYFDQDILEKNVSSYFSYSLPRFVKEYYVSYFYFNDENMAFCVSDYCSNVKISLKASINSFFTYENAKEYYISKGSLYDK